MDELKMEHELYQREVAKDHLDIRVDKHKFIKEIKNGLGDELVKMENYIKKPSKRKIFWNKIKRILWNV